MAFWKRFLADYICKIARKPINRAFVWVSVECQKFWIWQRDRYFWHFGAGFWQITVVRIVGKPINRAFHGYLWNAKNLKFGRRRNVFGNVFGRGTKIFGIAVCESNQ